MNTLLLLALFGAAPLAGESLAHVNAPRAGPAKVCVTVRKPVGAKLPLRLELERSGTKAILAKWSAPAPRQEGKRCVSVLLQDVDVLRVSASVDLSVRPGVDIDVEMLP